MWSDRKKTFIVTAALLLIPVILGLTPFVLAQRLADGGPHAHHGPCFNHYCPFHSRVSNSGMDFVVPNSRFPHEPLPIAEPFGVTAEISAPFNSIPPSVPLRC
jgi:hypothetical protein